jgi:hypothetical protein
MMVASVPMHVRLAHGVIIALLMSAILASPGAAQPARQAMPDVQKLGPQVGARVPDFSLTDQNGQLHTLRSVMGPKGAMLVFFRSADW